MFSVDVDRTAGSRFDFSFKQRQKEFVLIIKCLKMVSCSVNGLSGLLGS